MAIAVWLYLGELLFLSLCMVNQVQADEILNTGMKGN